MTEQLRREFEAWAEDYGHDISRSETDPDDYHDLVTEWVFDAWKAARAEPERKVEPAAFCEDAVLTLAERAFSTEIDEQMAEDIIQFAQRLHSRWVTAPKEQSDE